MLSTASSFQTTLGWGHFKQRENLVELAFITFRSEVFLITILFEKMMPTMDSFPVGVFCRYKQKRLGINLWTSETHLQSFTNNAGILDIELQDIKWTIYILLDIVAQKWWQKNELLRVLVSLTWGW